MSAGDALSVGVDRAARRALVAAAGDGVAGVDRVQVLSNLPGSPGHRAEVPVRCTLLVWTSGAALPADLPAEQVRIVGGVRVDPMVNPVRVRWAYRADRLVAGADAEPGPADRELVADAVPAADRSRVLAVRTSSSGDWSTYVLELRGAGGRPAPAGFDPPLARAPFAFTVDLPSDMDDRPAAAPAPAPVSPALDYLARDYAALRTRLLDRLATLLPTWADRGPADPVVTVAELFAALGDRFAAWQDAVAAEAYLGTARRRTSVTRHARLLDYRVHEGCSARTWLSFTTGDVLELPAGLPVADGPPAGVDPHAAGPASAAEVARDGGTVFETCFPVTVRPEHNRCWLHSWGVPDHVLPVGSTSAFLQHPADAPPRLVAGDVLVLAATGPSGDPADGDPTDRHPVRLVADPVRHVDALAPGLGVLELRWGGADALPRPLVVAVRDGTGRPRLCAVAVGNVVLADHGATLPTEPLLPGRVPTAGEYRPRLRHAGLTWADPATPRPAGASAALDPDPRRAVPAVTVHDGTRRWEPRLDLVGAGPATPAFAVERERDGGSRLRFGDGVTGRRPDAGTVPRADYRVGGTAAGNVAAGVLTTVLAPVPGAPSPAVPSPAVPSPNAQAPAALSPAALARLRVTNLLTAAGGTDPEPVATVRERAPRAFRTQQRAVTLADFAAAALRQPGVTNAVARRRWTGSWYDVEVTVDTDADRTGDTELWAALAAVLDAQRMTGVDVTLGPPTTVPLEIALRVRLVAGYPRAEARRQLADAFGTGAGGFFHPDRFTFGQPLLLTDVVLAAMSVTGVDAVEVGDDATGLRFRRWGRPAAGEAARQRIDVGAREVLRADGDPARPEHGRVDVMLVGGT